MEAEFDFTPLVVVSVLAVAVPVLLARFPRAAVPIVVGEILAGMLVGPYGLGLIDVGRHPALDFLALFGFAYLMFLSGLEIDFDLLRKGGAGASGSRLARWASSPSGTAMASFAATVVASIVLALWLVSLDLARDPILMALILATTSLGVVMPVLKERGLSTTSLGQDILLVSVVSDFATITLVSAYVLLHTNGLTLDVLLVLVLIAVAALGQRVAYASRGSAPLRRLFQELSHATAQLDTRAALALALIFIALADSLGVEVILGAFLAGAIVSILAEGEEASVLRPKLNAIGYGFFIPIFFIMVGVTFDLDALRASPRGLRLVPVLVLAAFLVKLAGSLLYRRRHDWRGTLALGTLTSARLSLIIAVAAIGMEIGAIAPATNAAIVLVAITTVIVAPLLFNRLTSSVQDARPQRIVVVGGSSPEARLLIQRLARHGEEVALVTRLPLVAQEAKDEGVQATLARDGLLDGLAEAGAEGARAIVLMLEDSAEAEETARAARSRFEAESIVVLSRDPAASDRLRAAGIDVVEPGFSTVLVLETMARHPKMLTLLADQDTDREIAEVRVRSPSVAGRRLRDLRLPGDALLVGIDRQGEMLVPRGQTRLEPGDRITVIGSREAIAAAARVLGGTSP